MPSLGSGELIVIFVLVLVLFGPHRLPELARSIGRGMREIRKVTGEFQSQLSLLADEEDARKAPIQFPATTEEPEPPAAAPRLDQIKWEPHPDALPVDETSLEETSEYLAPVDATTSDNKKKDINA